MEWRNLPSVQTPIMDLGLRQLANFAKRTALINIGLWRYRLSGKFEVEYYPHNLRKGFEISSQQLNFRETVPDYSLSFWHVYRFFAPQVIPMFEE